MYYHVRIFFETEKEKTFLFTAKSREEIYNILISNDDFFNHRDENGELQTINLRQTKYVSISESPRKLIEQVSRNMAG